MLADPPDGQAAVAAPEVLIRPMRPDDLDEALAVFTAVAAEGQWLGTEAGFDPVSRREAWLAGLADKHVGTLVVEEVGTARLLGHGSTHLERYGVAEVGMSLAADGRGRGIGGLLLDALIDAARALGAHKVDLQVWPHNEPALRLYLSRGFVVEGRLRAHYRRASGQVWDALLMGLVLDPEMARRGSPFPDVDCVPTTLDLRQAMIGPPTQE